MRFPDASLRHQVLLSFLGVLLLLGPSCEQPAERPPTATANPTPPFRPVSYQLTRLDESTFLDSLRALPRADSTLIKCILVPGQKYVAFDSATAYYRYRTFALGPNRAEVVAGITEFDGITGKLQLLLFTPDNRWVTSVNLASYFDGHGATQDYTSIQLTPTTFRQQHVTEELIEKPGTKVGKDPEWLAGTTTAHYLLRFDNNRFSKRQLDSTYVIAPYKD